MLILDHSCGILFLPCFHSTAHRMDHTIERMLVHPGLEPPKHLLSSYSTNKFDHIKSNVKHVLIHSNIVNRYQLLCDVYTVSEQHMGTAAIFLYNLLLHFSSFSVCVFVTLSELEKHREL